MAEMHHLKRREKVPHDGDWVAVSRAVGGFKISASLRTAKAASSGLGSAETLPKALARAEEQAARLNIPTIYVIGGPDA